MQSDENTMSLPISPEVTMPVSEPFEPAATAECPRCHTHGKNETYWYLKHQYLFDVDLAREFVADGRSPVEVSQASVRESVELSDICEEHIPHVDPTNPGIIAHVQLVTDSGEVLKGHLLIDGNHRAARSLQIGRPFMAYLLSEDESRKILLKHPNGLRSEGAAE
jgi:hypothetical protein